MTSSKTILIDGTPVAFRASAFLTRLYRLHFHRDILQDMIRLEKSLRVAKEKEAEARAAGLDAKDMAVAGAACVDFEILENVAYIMAKHADGSVGSLEEFFSNHDTFSIYGALGEILSLWSENIQTIVPAKKKVKHPGGK